MKLTPMWIVIRVFSFILAHIRHDLGIDPEHGRVGAECYVLGKRLSMRT